MTNDEIRRNKILVTTGNAFFGVGWKDMTNIRYVYSRKVMVIYINNEITVKFVFK